MQNAAGESVAAKLQGEECCLVAKDEGLQRCSSRCGAFLARVSLSTSRRAYELDQKICLSDPCVKLYDSKEMDVTPPLAILSRKGIAPYGGIANWATKIWTFNWKVGGGVFGKGQ